MLRNWLMLVAALPLCSVGMAMADAPADKAVEAPASGPIGQYQPAGVTAMGEYWIGIQCMPVMPALRTQLNLPEQQGLLVGAVAPKSPAAAASVLQYDILMRVGDKPLHEPRELIAAVEATKSGKLKIELIRSGKPKTIEVAPAKRPKEAAMVADAPSAEDWAVVQKWMEGMVPGQPVDGRGNVMFRIVHPGAIVSKDVLINRPLPANLSVSVSREGDQPAKIKVQRGKEKWEVTEKELDKLPADIRPFVVPMLGHGSIGLIGTFKASDVPNPPQPGATATAPVGGGPIFYQQIPAPGMTDQRLEKRLDEMNGRIDKLVKLMERMAEDRPHTPATPPAPAPQAEKK